MKKYFNKFRTHDVAFLARMPAGIPGDVSRKEGAVVEVRQFDATNPPTAYGVPVVVDASSQGVRHVLSTDVGASIYGFLIRPFPISNFNTTDGLGQSAVNTNMPGDVARKAYMNALLQNTTAAVLNGQVYVRLAATSGSLLQGGLEAAGAATVTSPAIVGTGTGTIAATVADASKIQKGTYVITVATTSNTSAVSVVDPNGVRLADGKIGVAYSDEGLAFTITAAGTMTAGDTFSPVVTLTNAAIPNCIFMGAADSTGNVEIAYKQ